MKFACKPLNRSQIFGIYFIILAISVSLYFVNEICKYVICSIVVLSITFISLYVCIHFSYMKIKESKDNNVKVTPVSKNDTDIDSNDGQTPTVEMQDIKPNDNTSDGASNEDVTIVYKNDDDIQLENQSSKDSTTEIGRSKIHDDDDARDHWIDNLRTNLEVGVIIHHSIVIFGGIGWWYYQIGDYKNTFQIFTVLILSLNQSFGTCLFFFISGYFTPLSCDKKGRKKFLYDKFKKFGIPLIVFFYILNPLIVYLTNVFIGHKYNKFFIGLFKHGVMFTLYGAGPGWYLIWLLIFSVCYVTFGDNISIYKMKFPSFTVLFSFAAIVGILQYFIVSLDTFIYLPIEHGSLYFDIFAFTGGIIAQRNNWLTDGISKMSFKKKWILRLLVVIGGIICLIVAILCYQYDYGFILAPEGITDDCNDHNDQKRVPEWIWILWHGFMGFIGVVLAINTLQFTEEYSNFCNKYTEWFRKQAYVVFLIHPLVLTPFAWTWIAIMNKMGANIPQFCDHNWSSKTEISGDGFIWFGFFYTTILTLIFVWPLAWIVRQLPLVRNIL